MRIVEINFLGFRSVGLLHEFGHLTFYCGLQVKATTRHSLVEPVRPHRLGQRVRNHGRRIDPYALITLILRELILGVA